MGFIKGILLGAFCVWIYQFYKQMQRKKIHKEYDLSNTSNQQKFIEGVQLYGSRPINKEAFKQVYLPLEKLLANSTQNYRLLAEVALGAFIKTHQESENGQREKRAFSSYNSKRADFLIIDLYGNPALVIEYHGSGHFQGNAVKRDQIKKIALEQAKIPLIEVYENDKPEKIQKSVRKVLNI